MLDARRQQPCLIPPSSFSEMSPACFRPVFDAIREMWFDGCATERKAFRWLATGAGVCPGTSAFQFAGEWGVVTAVLEKEDYGKNYGKENEFKKRQRGRETDFHLHRAGRGERAIDGRLHALAEKSHKHGKRGQGHLADNGGTGVWHTSLPFLRGWSVVR
jgi:hypothetical protein